MSISMKGKLRVATPTPTPTPRQGQLTTLKVATTTKAENLKELITKTKKNQKETAKPRKKKVPSVVK